MGDSWWEERFLMALFLKLVWSSWRIRCLVFLKFLVVPVSGKSFMNEGLECGCLGCAVIAKFSEPSLRFLLMYAFPMTTYLSFQVFLIFFFILVTFLFL